MSQLTSALTFNQLNRLQDAAAYRNFLSHLRSSGLRTVYIGVVLCGAALTALRYPFGLIPFLLLGLWLASYGIMMFKFGVVPKARLFDVAFIVILVINAILLVYETLVFPPAAGQIARSSIGLPMQLITWLFFPFMYKRSLKRLPAQPDQSDLHRLDQIVKELRQSYPEMHQDVITFYIDDHQTKRRYKGQLGAEIGIFTDIRGKEVTVLAKREVRISPTTQAVDRQNALHASFQFGNQTLTGVIAFESFAKYQQWKNSM